MKEAAAALWKLATGDLSPAERSVLIKVWAKVGWRLMIGMHVLYACGWLAAFGFSGFAQADDVDRKLDVKVAAATRPLAEQIKEANDTLAQTNRVLQGIGRQVNDQVANSIASEVRYLISKRCKETDPGERDRLQREIDRKQTEFYELKQRRYDFGCGDV